MSKCQEYEPFTNSQKSKEQVLTHNQGFQKMIKKTTEPVKEPYPELLSLYKNSKAQNQRVFEFPNVSKSWNQKVLWL